MPGTLYIVATPIGNLEDISPRTKRILADVALIACEDTRHTRKLLSHLGLSTPLTSYYREKEQYKAEVLLEKLIAGQDLALVSDAGTPGLSDPGAVLVRQARGAGIKIVPIPGPSALAVAISVAGLTENSFFFGGFPPSRKAARRTLFKGLAALPWPLIFYESPHRIRACLEDCLATLGNRQVLLCRELTKLYEECIPGSVTTVLARVTDGIKGELVLIVHPPAPIAEEQPDNLTELLAWYHDQPDMTLKEAVHRISEDLGLARNMVYREALAVWQDKR
ncbi:MAG: 16S rRNA (cytidine(1402)-2'-O)-methyltransferase [Desulfobulbus sp.]|jgi:16S rRNA (cytidine1402-2'-O)-methyltransferase|nr:MAG: 16S rRNA (cytidine(1402)-2'-O)-methyltransferase [Desulfobulbus sp.]